MCCVMVLWWEQRWKVDCQGRREEEDWKKCYWAGYWRQVTKTWIIYNSRSWYRSGQDDVDGKRKPARRAKYGSSKNVLGPTYGWVKHRRENFTTRNSVDVLNAVEQRGPTCICSGKQASTRWWPDAAGSIPAVFTMQYLWDVLVNGLVRSKATSGILVGRKDVRQSQISYALILR